MGMNFCISLHRAASLAALFRIRIKASLLAFSESSGVFFAMHSEQTLNCLLGIASSRIVAGG